MNTAVTKPPVSTVRQYALMEAHEAVVKLFTLKPFLSSRDEDTLALLIDKKLMRQLKKSLAEAKMGNVEPLKNILK